MEGSQETERSEEDFQKADEDALRKGWTFPWVHLTHSDLNILISTHESLKDPTHAVESCYFLADVVCHDFPPEVFIQRPEVIKVSVCGMHIHVHTTFTWNAIYVRLLSFFQALLLLISSPVLEGRKLSVLASLHCLTRLTNFLLERLAWHSDPICIGHKKEVKS